MSESVGSTSKNYRLLNIECEQKLVHDYCQPHYAKKWGSLGQIVESGLSSDVGMKQK